MKYAIFILSLLGPDATALAAEGSVEKGSQLFVGLMFAGAITFGLLLAYVVTLRSARVAAGRLVGEPVAANEKAQATSQHD